MKVAIKVPAAGESITEATVAEWIKKTGEAVKRDEILLVLETDKASLEVVAEKEGVLEIQVPEGENVEVGATLGFIDTEATASAPSPTPLTPPPLETPVESSPPRDKEIPEKPQQSLSPAVRRLVEENHLDPKALGAGSGKGGRLTKADVLTSLQRADSSGEMMRDEIHDKIHGQVRRVPMTKLRQTIARRLVEAQHTAAILTTFNEIDMSAVMKLRAKYKDSFKEKHGVSLGFMGFFVKATIEALKAFPQVNAEIDGTDIVSKNFINMGIAISTDKGLLVPVIRQADQLSVAEIELSIRHYAIKAREGKISLEDLAQGTFTISNGGVFGSLLSTPILNPPQSGILGLHKIEERPIALKGEVVVRPMMYVALSYDHRIIDGRESVSFLVKIKEAMEDPPRLLLEV